MMGSFTCPHCKTKNACNCDTCSKYIKEGETIVKYTEDGELFICAKCDKIFTPDQAIDQEYEERFEKYSERFDNKNNEIAKGIFNPDNWGKRIVKQFKKK
jgi:transcription elongation factor Elf1